MKIILASASPRRKELLGHIFPEFTIIPAKGEEHAVFHTPDQYVQDLAVHKAREIADMHFHTVTSYAVPLRDIAPDSLTMIIGADTIVYAQGQLLGKPADPEEAFEMLSLLSGKAHKVFTGVAFLFLRCVSENAEKREPIFELVAEHAFSEETEVFVDALTKNEIDAYIASSDPFDKAGGYGIQGLFSKHITKIRGDYFNVVGLPVSRIYRELRGILPQLFCPLYSSVSGD